MQPSELRRLGGGTVCIPPCWEGRRARCGSGRPRYVPASVGFLQTNKDVFSQNGWLCGCVGGAVLSKLTSHQQGLSSSPRFWPSVQVCMSVCGFPAVCSHSPKNMHIRRLHIPPGCECVSCGRLDLCVPAWNRRPSPRSPGHKTCESVPVRACLFITAYSQSPSCSLARRLSALKTPLQPRPQVTYFNAAETGQLWRHTLRKSPLPPSHHSPSFPC